MSTQIHIANSFLSVELNYSGAELCSVKNKDGIEFIWQADKAVWPRHAPVLFPIVGKLKGNKFIFEDETYELSQHGFARDKDFELIESNDHSCLFQLKSDDGTRQQYPFDFIFQIKYELQQNKLITSYRIINPSHELLIFSVGAHPGFICPLKSDEVLEDYYLEFENSEYRLTKLSNGLRLDAKEPLILKDKKLFLSKHLFDNDALVFENSQINQISMCSSKSGHKIAMSCHNWPYFGIWAKPGQNFVCLEPWYGIADRENASQNLTEKEGMIRLKGKEEFSCSFTIEFF